MITNLKGRLRNTVLGANSALLPMFECIVNSIQSVEMASKESGIDLRHYSIKVKIFREEELFKDDDSLALAPIIGFEIIDDGIGFNERNIESFNTLDSDHKLHMGCKGIGRLVWLKAFESVEVNSLTKDDEGKSYKVAFSFDAEKGMASPKIEPTQKSSSSTNIRLLNPYPKFRSAFPKKIETLAQEILEHCIWYFLRDEGCPSITLVDDSSSESISIQDRYSETVEKLATRSKFTIKGEQFTAIHLRLRRSSDRSHRIALAGNSRVVRQIDISDKIAGLSKDIQDGAGRFIHVSYVSSSYLDGNVHPQREDFTFAKSQSDDLFGMPTIEEILESAVLEARNSLETELDEVLRRGQKKTQSFIENKAPRYKSISDKIEISSRVNDPSLSDLERELLLHKELSKYEELLLSEGHQLAKSDIEDTADYTERLDSYLGLLNTLKQSDLVDYVFHRRTIIDILKKAVSLREDGKYELEEIIHKIFIPMGIDGVDCENKDFNLWLIDESLAFHTYLSSDKTMKSSELSGSNSLDRPDVISSSTNVSDNPILVGDSGQLRQPSFNIIEFKKPMKEGRYDPVDQVLRYVERARKGKLKNQDGRLLSGSEEIPAYCYAICDLNSDSVVRDLKIKQFTASADGQCYYGYIPEYKAFVKVMNFDHVIEMAEQRNYAYFEKLGLPVSRS